MEYPMCTMLESGRSDFFSTACHEFMHNYFYGMFGTDENLYHWMDEGLTSYAEERISNVNELSRNPSIFEIDYDGIMEVIAVDDCSKDKTGEILDRLKKKYKKLRVIHNEKNL